MLAPDTAARYRGRVRALPFVLLASLLACEPRTRSSDRASPAPPTPAPSSFASRPYDVHVPPGLDRSRPAPLVVSLHGYGAPSGEAHARAFGFAAMADEHGFVLATPDGTVDSHGSRYWNATDACCNFDHAGVDDVAYIAWLIDDAVSKLAIDRDRVFVLGHSNGGFLAHRLACDLAPRLAGAVSIAGAGWKDTSRCAPGEPVSILEIHGDADVIIRMRGGRVFNLPVPEYPSTQETLAGWLAQDSCGVGAQPAPASIDFDDGVPGVETTRLSYRDCRAGVTVDLWTVVGGSHVPHPSRAGLTAIAAWMTAHPKHAR